MPLTNLIKKEEALRILLEAGSMYEHHLKARNTAALEEIVRKAELPSVPVQQDQLYVAAKKMGIPAEFINRAIA